MSFEIFVNPEGDWYSVEKNGEVIVSGHRPSIEDVRYLVEYFSNEHVEVIEDEYVGE